MSGDILHPENDPVPFEMTAPADGEYLSAEDAYELLHAGLVRSGAEYAARELKFWHDQANYWMGQYSNVIGEC